MISSVLRFRQQVRRRKAQKAQPSKFGNVDELTNWHFRAYSDPGHINRVGLTLALRQLDENPALVIETGTSAWGTDSSRLFAQYVESFGGAFYTVDIRKEPSDRLEGALGKSSHLIVGDSVSFLEGFDLPTGFKKVDLAYLDSWDLDLENPLPAMEHGLKEWKALYPLLGPGSIVVIDDTPIEWHLLGDKAKFQAKDKTHIAGKGRLILQDDAVFEHFQMLYHHYNVVMKWVK